MYIWKRKILLTVSIRNKFFTTISIHMLFSSIWLQSESIFVMFQFWLQNKFVDGNFLTIYTFFGQLKRQFGGKSHIRLLFMSSVIKTFIRHSYRVKQIFPNEIIDGKRFFTMLQPLLMKADTFLLDFFFFSLFQWN